MLNEVIKKDYHAALKSIKHRSWILLLSSSNTLTKRFLENSGFEPLFSKKQDSPIHYWVKNNAVVITHCGTNVDTLSAWLGLAKQSSNGSALNQILILQDCRNITLSTLPLEALHLTPKGTHLNFAIADCQTLTGFTSFFSDLSNHERDQAFGLTIEKSGVLRTKPFFNRINSRLMWRLQHERNTNKLAGIIRCPFELEKMLRTLQAKINKIEWPESTQLSSLYITGKDFFINALLQKSTQHAKNSAVLNEKSFIRRLIAMPIALAGIAAISLIWQISFDTNAQTLSTLKSNLSQSTIPSMDSKFLWMHSLDQLTQINQTLRTKNVLLLSIAGFVQTTEIQHLSQKKLGLLLKNYFKPYLRTLLEETIVKSMSGNPFQLYHALKIYIMLNQHKYYNADTVKQWFNLYWSAHYPGDTTLQTHLNTYLKKLLQENPPPWKGNTTLITQAQNTLQAMPLADRAFLTLQEQYPASSVSILPKKLPLAGIDTSHAKIPLFYSPTVFNQIYEAEIPKLRTLMKKGNWVFGTTKGISLTNAENNALSGAVEKLYVNQYAQQWLNVVPNIQIDTPLSLKQVLLSIRLITDQKSPLNQLLNIVIGNATLNQQMNQAIEKSNNPSFKAIDSFVKQGNNYKLLTASLNQLATYISSIAQAGDIDKAGYQAAAARFNSNGADDPITNIYALAIQSPEPMRSWLNTLANQTWKLLLSHSKNYLNLVWSTTVYPQYDAQIKGRFPVFKNSRRNISYVNFGHFFGPGGSTEIFFNYFLKPFVNTNQRYWTWNKLDGQKIDIPRSTLNMLLRASLIQQMFYTDNLKIPSMKLSLTPIQFSANVNTFAMNFAGQLHNFTISRPKTTIFNWPGPHPENGVTIRFNTSTNSAPLMTETGPWAWLRLLQTATLQTTSNAEQFNVTFNDKKVAASFILVTDNKINPYLPGVLDAFRCPKNL